MAVEPVFSKNMKISRPRALKTLSSIKGAVSLFLLFSEEREEKV
jgi:hypothetical protein